MSPNLFTADPQQAPTIMSAIASNPATVGLAQALARSWAQDDPLHDPAVQAAGQNAVQAAIQALAAPGSAQTTLGELQRRSRQFEVPPLASTALSAWSPATVAVTPNCRPSGDKPSPGLPCLDLDYLSFPPGSIAVNQGDGSYDFSPENCTAKIGGCAVGWLGRITPIPPSSDGGDPSTIVAGGRDPFNPQSPVGTYDSNSCDSAGSGCITIWIDGNSAFQYLDLKQLFLAGLSNVLQQVGLGMPAAGPVFVLPLTTQHEADYIARFYSGGTADAAEQANVQVGAYNGGQSRNLGTQARGLNLLASAFNGIEALSILPDGALSCALEHTLSDVFSGAITIGGTSDLSGVQTDFINVLGDALNQIRSCIEDNLLDSIITMIGDVGAWGSGAGTVVKFSGVVSNAGEALQRQTELAFSASPVETAVIAIVPGSVVVRDPVPSITSLSPTSVPAGSSSVVITVVGKNFISTSIVSINGVTYSTTFVDTAHLTVTLGPTDLASTGTLSLVVTNPGGAGNQSKPASFVVQTAVTTPTLQSLTLSAASVVGGSSVAGTVTLSSPAPTGGVEVTLSSDNSTVQVPPSVMIASGQSSANFTITTTTPTSTQTATISALLGASTVAAVLTVSPGGGGAVTVLSVTGNCGSQGALNSLFSFGVYWTQTTSYYDVNIDIPITTDFSSTDGTPVLAFLSNNFAPEPTVSDEVAHASFVIPLGSSPNTLVRIFTGLALGPGQYFLTVYAPTQSYAGGWCVATNAPTTSSAMGVTEQYTYLLNGYNTYPPAGGFIDYWATAEISITGVPGTPPPTTATLQPLMLSPTSVTGGGSATGTVTLSAPAPNSGVQVTLSSSNPSVRVPASVTVAPGQNSAPFTITTQAVTSAQTVSITASLGASTVTATLTLNPSPPSGITLQGKIFQIDGTLTISGSKLPFEIQAIPSGVSHMIGFEELTPLYPQILLDPFTSNASISGNTATFHFPECRRTIPSWTHLRYRHQ